MSMMKMDGILPTQSSKSDTIGTLFRIVTSSTSSATSNKTQTLQLGQTFTLVAPKVIQGKVTLNIGGQNIILENFPKSLQEKNISLQVVKNKHEITLQLIATGKKEPMPTVLKTTVDSSKNKIGKASNNTLQAVKSKPVKPTLPPRTAQLVSSLDFSLQQQNKLSVIVMQSSKKTASLQIIPEHKSTHQNIKPQITANKTAQAVAQVAQPEKIILTNKQTATMINIDHLSTPLKKGEHLTLELLATKNGNQTAIMLKNMESPVLNTKKVSIDHLTLTKNQQFSSKVEQRLPSGHITFNWQGQSFEANAPKHIQVGDILLLKVEQAGKKPHLTVLDRVQKLPEKASALFRKSIAQNTPMVQVLKTLMQLQTTTSTPASTQLTALTNLLDNFAISSDKPLDGTRLMSMIRDSGLMHEALLGKFLNSSEALIKRSQPFNLKSALLDIEEAIQTTQHTKKSTTIKQTAEQGVNRIESQQALNLLAFQQVEPVRIELPIMIQGQWSTILMAISNHSESSEETQQNQSSSGSFNILFSLDLSKLGNIRIDARITNASVHAGFYTESQQVRHFIQQNISRLSDRLEATGFTEIQLSTASHKQMIVEKTEQFHRLEAGLPISKGLLDVTG